jgi:hypothetical protein
LGELREDIEDIGMRVFGGSTGTPAAVLAWAMAAFRVLAEVAISREQHAVAADILEVWGLTLPHTFWPKDGPPRAYERERIPLVRMLFEKMGDVCKSVGALRGVGLAAVDEVETFCRAELGELDHLSTIGDITCEVWVFDRLIRHCQQLLGVVLGEKEIAIFARAYDQAMAILKQMEALASAPKV